MQASFLLCYLAFISGIFARKCGAPQQPQNGWVEPRNDFYSEGDYVNYTCIWGYYSLQDSVLVNRSTRWCQCNGKWNGTPLTCEYKTVYWDAYGNISSSSQKGQILRDNSDQTCATWKANRNGKLKFTSRFYYINAHVLYLRVKFDTQRNNANGTVKLTNEWNRVICDTDTFVIPRQTPLIARCRLTSQLSETQMSISFEFQNDKAEISICSLEGLVQTTSCVQPDQLFHGFSSSVANKNPPLVQYTCNPGFTLRGTDKVECGWTIENGTKWNSTDFPICVSEVEKKNVDCRPLPTIENGRMQLLAKPSCPEKYGAVDDDDDDSDIAVIHCNAGFTSGTRTLIAYCNAFTNWTWKLHISDNPSLPFKNVCIPSPASNTGSFTARNQLSSDVSISLITIGVLLTIINLTYILYRCTRKNKNAELNRLQAEDTDCNSDTLVQRAGCVSQSRNEVPLTVLNPATTTRATSSLNDHPIYCEIQEHPPNQQPASSNLNLHNNELYSVIEASSKENPYHSLNPSQDHYSNVESVYADVVQTHYTVNGETYAQVTKNCK